MPVSPQPPASSECLTSSRFKLVNDYVPLRPNKKDERKSVCIIFDYLQKKAIYEYSIVYIKLQKANKCDPVMCAFNGTINQFEYIKILEEVMLPYAEKEMTLKRVFQQDNDPKRSSKQATS
ncbi:hypothetical protein P4O66_000515 [Electrophorus voltai]|uniref:Uncharacterized protein n=1 Tax=Electrophorus voltai TaxID=2609070 RepID=A0AAD8ZFF2_9TELE|nr:hypothetical protein P4O66_000515 [Electrophorus voltai]